MKLSGNPHGAINMNRQDVSVIGKKFFGHHLKGLGDGHSGIQRSQLAAEQLHLITVHGSNL
jgi:hypothetical protein